MRTNIYFKQLIKKFIVSINPKTLIKKLDHEAIILNKEQNMKLLKQNKEINDQKNQKDNLLDKINKLE